MAQPLSKQEQEAVLASAIELTMAVNAEKQKIQELEEEMFDDPPEEPYRVLADDSGLASLKKTLDAGVQYPAPKRYTSSFADFLKEDKAEHPSISRMLLGCHPFLKAMLYVVLATIALITVEVIGWISVVVYYILLIASWAAIICWARRYYAKEDERYAAKKFREEEKYENDPEYLKTREDAEKQYMAVQESYRAKLRVIQNQQKELDQQYQDEMKKYNTVTLPAYNKDKEEWKRVQDAKLDVLEKDLSANENNLQTLYDTTKIVSVHFRGLPELTWLYSEMSTSNHDLERATDLLEHQLNRETMERCTAQSVQAANRRAREMTSAFLDGLDDVIDHIDYSAAVNQDALDQISGEMGQVRKDIVLGNISNGINSVRTNRKMDDISKGVQEINKEMKKKK